MKARITAALLTLAALAMAGAASFPWDLRLIR